MAQAVSIAISIAVSIAVSMALSIVGACTTATTFRAPGANVPGHAPRGSLVVDERNYGAIPPAGVEVPVAPGFAPVAWRIVDGGEVLAEGTVERDQVAWGVVIGAGIAAACCIPSAAATGFCLANPALLAAPVTCLAGNPGAIVTACAAPGWTSVPMAGVGAAVGATPLLFGFMGQHPPPSVELTAVPTLPVDAVAPNSDLPGDPDARPNVSPAPTSPDTGAGGMWF